MLTSIGQCRVATDVQFIKNKRQDICQVYKTKYACIKNLQKKSRKKLRHYGKCVIFIVLIFII